ncbi:Uncharacterised protein [uncultured Clostridium sp.]|nr:Uncharacterised protein [uncultured Clostridium sp.]
MKKLILILSLVLTLGLVGCSKGSEYKNVSASTVEKAITSSGLLVEQSMNYNITDFDYFNDIKDSIEEGFMIRAAINIALEDILFIKTSSEDDANKAFEALETYKEGMIMRPFGDGYGKEENATRAANTVIEKKGNYVYLISADNVEKINQLIIDTITK